MQADKRDGGQAPTVSGSQGVQIGTGNVQINLFGLSEAGWAGPAFAVPPLTGREVIRPALYAEAKAALLGTGISGLAAMTTRVAGASGGGGFGKSTLARLVAHDPDVREHFSDGIVWVTMGQGVADPDSEQLRIADKVNNLTGLFTGVKPALTDALAAGARLAGVLAGRRVLVIVDDIWDKPQLPPFLIASTSGSAGRVVLVTTRNRRVLPDGGSLVYVEAMARDEAVELLTSGLPPGAPPSIVGRVLDLTSNWPVLLGLVNGAARIDVAAGLSPGEALGGLAEQLAAEGPDGLELEDDASRGRAVTATMRASMSRLSGEEQERYKELAVFAAATEIPLELLERYWRRTAAQVTQFCRFLADLSLVARYRLDGAAPRVQLHDIIRSWLRHDAADRLPGLHAQLLAAHRDLVPVVGGRPQWQALPVPPSGPATRYLWESLPGHLRGANLDDELSAVLTAPRWLLGKLAVTSAASLEADLSPADDPVCRALSQVVRQNAHLFAPLAPEGALAATIASRFPADPQLARVKTALTATIRGPYLGSARRQPDHAAPHLLRRLAVKVPPAARLVHCLLVGPDGSWLASAGNDGTVRVWEPGSGARRDVLTSYNAPTATRSAPTALAAAPDGSWQACAYADGTVRILDSAWIERHVLVGHTGPVWNLRVAPDGSWLSSTGNGDGTVRIWDPNSGTERHVLPADSESIKALAVAPDGSWLASAGNDGTVRIWDPASGAERHTLTGHSGAVEVLAVAPDGSWLASAGYEDRTVRIWDPNSGAEHHVLTGHREGVQALAVAPDNSWLASSDYGGTIRIWDPTSGTGRHVLSGHSSSVPELMVAPDGSWLASASWDRTVRIWNPCSGTERHVLTGHTMSVYHLVVAPDGSWLASAGEDGTVRIWDPAPRAALHAAADENVRPLALAVAPDGSWLASIGNDGKVRVWDPTGAERHALTGHTNDRIAPSHDQRGALAVAPDGSWLASAWNSHKVRIWDPATGAERHVLAGDTSERIRVLAVAPDGSWLASAGDGGTVRTWDPATGAERHALALDMHERVQALVVAPDGSWLAAGAHRVQIWDAATGTERRQPVPPDPGRTVSVWNWVYALAVAPDGSWLASGSEDGTVRIWDRASGVKRHSLVGHSGIVSALAVAPDGSWLASAGEDGTVRIWNPASGVTRHALAGHSDRVRALAVAPDRSWLASAGEDGTVRIWDPVSGAAVTALRVDDSLHKVGCTRSAVVAAGGRGLYMFRLTVKAEHPYP